MKDVFTILSASCPFEEYPEKMMLYGQFIGSWDIESIWYEKDGHQRKSKGEWHFAWILGGRGVQDVLFAAGSPPNRYGTTLRCYDNVQDIWHICWMQPYGGEFTQLIGKKVDDRVVQESISVDPHRRERWSFVNITANSSNGLVKYLMITE